MGPGFGRGGAGFQETRRKGQAVGVGPAGLSYDDDQAAAVQALDGLAHGGLAEAVLVGHRFDGGPGDAAGVGAIAQGGQDDVLRRGEVAEGAGVAEPAPIVWTVETGRAIGGAPWG